MPNQQTQSTTSNSSKPKQPQPQVTVSDKAQRQNLFRKTYEAMKKQYRSTRDSISKHISNASNAVSGGNKEKPAGGNWYSNLSENQRLALYMALAGAAGGGVGAFAGGKENRALGALVGALGAAAITGLARPATDAISSTITAVNPPPESQFDGVGTSIARTAPLFAVPLAFQLAKPSAARLNRAVQAVDTSKMLGAEKELWEGKTVTTPRMDPTTGLPVTRVVWRADRRGRIRPVNEIVQDVTHTPGLKERVADLAARHHAERYRPRGSLRRAHELSNLMDEVHGTGKLMDQGPASLGFFRNLMANKTVRRSLVGTTSALAAGSMIYDVVNRIKSNRVKMKNGW